MHIDDWLDRPLPLGAPKGMKYAKLMFLYFRLPAVLNMEVEEFYSGKKLFCTYEGGVFRCNGASRLGDIYLTRDFDREHGYETRVDISKCTNWSNRPDGDYLEQ